MSDITVIENALLFDGEDANLLDGATVIIEGQRIREIGVGLKGPSGGSGAQVRTIDARGRFLMPGLIDAHFHAYTPTMNLPLLEKMPRPLLVSHAIRILEGAAQRGFTSVRDPAGGDVGLSMAVDQGLVKGPRFFYGGRAFSQTGGHGDIRGPGEGDICGCGAGVNVLSQVVDGPDEMRKAVREELRKGAHHIKVFISGGVVSPADPVWMPQFTDEELAVAVHEAATRRKYVVAHCHTDEGALRCVKAGIRSIDHGTIITAPTAKVIADTPETFVVPTMAIVHLILEEGTNLGLTDTMMDKAHAIAGEYNQSIENCMRAGVPLGLGTDLLGTEHHARQNREFLYRGELGPAIDVLRSATSINAEILKQKGEIGCLKAGAYADMLLIEGNPLEDISLMADPDKNFSMIMKGGDLLRDRLS